MKKKYILITGAAGFIGFHLCEKLLKLKNKIIGIDNLNSYYDVNLKKDRLKILKKYKQFKFYKFDLQNFKKLDRVFKKYKPNKVINLAAQAGVRYSLKNSKLYFNSNIKGFYNIIELSKIYKIKHFIFSSSSSVYGLNNKYPFSEDDSTNHPSNFYSATKKCNEIIAHSYAHLFSLPCTGLRYFTVYGPWGRPDMSLFSFTRSILNKVKIKIFNYGKMSRDFTYIDDAIKYTLKLINKIPKNNNNFKNYLLEKSNSSAPWVIYNIGNNKPIKIIKYIRILENVIGKKSKITFIGNKRTEITKTVACTKKLYTATKFKYKTKIADGIDKFYEWYKSYYNIKKILKSKYN